MIVDPDHQSDHRPRDGAGSSSPSSWRSSARCWWQRPRSRPRLPAQATPSSARTSCRALRRANGTSTGVGDTSIQGFATQISVNAGSQVQFKIDTTATRVLDQDLPSRLLPGRWCPADRHHSAPRRRSPQQQPACATDDSDRDLRLRHLVGLGVVERPGVRGLGGLHRPTHPLGHGGRLAHPVHRAQRRQHLAGAVPDLRHHLAGLQHLRRLGLLRRWRATVGRTRSATTDRSTPVATTTVATSSSPTSTR